MVAKKQGSYLEEDRKSDKIRSELGLIVSSLDVFSPTHSLTKQES